MVVYFFVGRLLASYLIEQREWRSAFLAHLVAILITFAIVGGALLAVELGFESDPYDYEEEYLL